VSTSEFEYAAVTRTVEGAAEARLFVEEHAGAPRPSFHVRPSKRPRARGDVSRRVAR